MLVNGTKLYYKKGDVTEYAELKKLTSLPDINVRKEKIENTHLCSQTKTCEFGIGIAPELEFGFIASPNADDMRQYFALLDLDTTNTKVDFKLVYTNGFTVTFSAQINITLPIRGNYKMKCCIISSMKSFVIQK